ncbi:MAG TPA: elongation factor G [Burkholderiaceae bacterium]|nr:elongation factor G [Burkholderiaceae bacterium]
MESYRTEDLRTVALVGHGAAGKTTLLEALLAKSSMIGAAGSVERGTTVSDHDPLEKQHHHSLRAAVCHADYKGSRLHLIDTPGYPDFVGQALGALDAVETVAVVVSATAGIELTTRRMMQAARERNLCRLIVVNKIDHEHIDLPALLAQLQEAFGAEVLPINLPAGGGARVIDCFGSDRGDADFLSVPEVHRKVLEQVVEVDDDAMARYLEQGDVDPTTLHAPLEKALRDGHLVPVCFVSARTGAGVLDLLEVMTRHLPHPGEGNPPQFLRGSGADAEQFQSVPDATRHVLAHVFKVVIDPYVGKIGIFRVHQGTLTPNSQLFIGDARRSFKVSHLLALQGKDNIEVPRLVPGDIGAIAKIDDITFDCVLHDSHEEDFVRMRPLDFPRPMVGLAIEPKRRGDEGRVSDILARMAAEDPTLRIEHDATLNETVMRGLSELHLRTVLERMSTQFKLEVSTRPPRVPYRETITAVAEGHARHKKQTGGAGQFGEVFLRVEPLERGAGFEFVDRVKGGVIPHQFLPAVEKGVREVYDGGHLAGFPMQDVRVIVHDGKHHPVDSKEVAFVAAGRKAFIDALAKSQPILLEPIVRIEIVCGGAQMGDIAGDLASRRGQVNGNDALAGGMMILRGTVPLAELDGYAGRLKAITQGHGSYTIELSHYDPVPPGVQQQMAHDFKARRKEAEE